MNIDFIASLEKAEEVDGRYYVSGVCSTTDRDAQNDVMTPAALTEMAKSAVGVPIVTSHNHELADEIGQIVDAKFDDNKLFIKAELDPEDPMAIRMFKKVEKAKSKVGLSIGANVKRLAPNRLDKSVRMTVDSVDWKHVMITNKPVTKNTFLIALNKALSEDLTMEPEVKTEAEAPTVEISKAGAMFSADNKAQLKAIHDGGNDDTKMKVRSMLGDDADDVLGAAMPSPEEAHSADDMSGMSDGSKASDDSDPLGVVNKSLEDIKASMKADFDALKSATIETIKEELAKAVSAKADAVTTLSKSQSAESGLRIGKNFSETFRLNVGG